MAASVLLSSSLPRAEGALIPHSRNFQPCLFFRTPGQGSRKKKDPEIQGPSRIVPESDLLASLPRNPSFEQTPQEIFSGSSKCKNTALLDLRDTQPVKNLLQCRRPGFDSWIRKICWRRDRLPTTVFLGFPDGSDGNVSACNEGDLGSIPGLGRSPGERNGSDQISRSVMSDSLRPHEPQHARPPCPSPTPGVH